jgi:hypothetical protein
MENMARISITPDGLHAEGIYTEDQPTIEYISQYAPEKRADAFVNCVQLGARVATYANDRLGASDICEKIDASADSAKKLLTGISASTTAHIDQAMKTAFGKDGTVSKFLEAQLKNVQSELEGKLDPDKVTSITARIRQAVKSDVADVLTQVRKDLDLTDPHSPLGLLQTDVSAKLQALDEKVTQVVTNAAVKSAVGVERLRGTQKGTDFEDAVHATLGELCRHRQDQLERTGNDTGSNGRSKCGDFVIDINPREAHGPGLRIAIEAKNDQAKRRDLLRELDKAMTNRNAQFAIGISTSPVLLPDGAPLVDFSSDNKILIYVDDYDPELGDFDPIYLEVAVNVARYICITTRDAQPSPLNAVQLDDNVVRAINALGRLSEIKRSLTSISNTANEAHTLVDAIRDNVRDALQTIRDAIDEGLAGGMPASSHLKSA